MKRREPPENTPRVIVTAVGFFGGAVVLGWWSGVFSVLSGEEILALTIFAAAFAALTYVADAGVRAAVKRGLAALRVRSGAPARSPGGRRVAP